MPIKAKKPLAFRKRERILLAPDDAVAVALVAHRIEQNIIARKKAALERSAELINVDGHGGLLSDR